MMYYGVTFTKERKIHIEHVVCRLYDVHYGISYLYENPIMLEENRLFAVIRETGDTWIYKKDNSRESGIYGEWIGIRDLKKDYDNCEELFPYIDEYVPFREYGIIHKQYT